MGRRKTADRGFNRRESVFRHEITMGRYRPVGKFFRPGIRFLHKGAAHGANGDASGFALP